LVKSTGSASQPVCVIPSRRDRNASTHTLGSGVRPGLDASGLDHDVATRKARHVMDEEAEAKTGIEDPSSLPSFT